MANSPVSVGRPGSSRASFAADTMELPRRGRTPARWWALALALLTVASWLFVFVVDGARISDVWSPQAWGHGRDMLSEMVGPKALRVLAEPARWRQLAGLAADTLAMSVLAILLAAAGMLLTVIPASRTAADGSLTLSRSLWGPVLYAVTRAAYTVSRAIPEPVWAMLLLFALTPGMVPAALALGVHNFGIVGKLCAEVVEDLDLRPVRALRACGAGLLASLAYGVLPAALPQFITYVLYRWEVIIRTTVVIGFVGASGLGKEFRLALSWFHYPELTAILAAYVALVLAVDATSGLLRRMAR